MVAELPQLDALSAREPLEALKDQAGPLTAALREALGSEAGLARLNAAAMLLMLQDPAGRDPFLAALSSTDAALRDAALRFLRSRICPRDSRRDTPHVTKVPLDGAEILACVRPYLREPWTGVNEAVLDLCLIDDIEGSRPITRRLLRHRSGALRLKAASRYLRQGRDDGALRVLEKLLAAAPSRAGRADPRWYDLKIAWLSVLDCCRAAAEPLRLEAARMAMRVLTAALDAPDMARRVHVNDGFVYVSVAVEAIACVMPEGAAALLERVIACDSLSDYDRGRALVAFAEAVGGPARPIVYESLAEPPLRLYAAEALGALGKGLDDPDDVARLAQALGEDDRVEVVSALVRALMDAGPGGRPHVEAALERADPWSRFHLGWALQGGDARRLADLLTEAGVIDAISDEQLAEAVEGGLDLRSIIWAGGRRMVVWDVKCDETPPPHHELFGELLAIARPAVRVDDLSQSHDDNYAREPVPGAPGVIKETDLGTVCTVRFRHEGRAHAFEARPSGRWMDVAAVMAGLDALMAAIGRDDRCFELVGDGSYAFLVVAPASRFLPLAERLRIPLEADVAGARDAAKAYARQIRESYSPG